MRFLILNTLYPEFLQWVYARDSGLQDQPYDEQMRARNESLFGVADFYSSNLQKLGHEALDINANNEWAQKAWASEHGIGVNEPTPVREWHEAMFAACGSLLRDGFVVPTRILKPESAACLAGGSFIEGAVSPISLKVLVLEICSRRYGKLGTRMQAHSC